MERRGILAVMVVMALLTGCVASKDYKARVAEIGELQKNVAGLDEKLKGTEKALADQKQKNDELSKQQEELTKQKNALVEENANLKSTLEASKGQLTKEVVELKNRISENKVKIKALEDELAARDKQIAEFKTQIEQLSQEKEKAVKEKELAISNVKTTYDSLVSELKHEIKVGEVQITQLKDKLTVNMVEKILFDSGSAVIKKNGKKVLERVADILKNVKGQQIKVEGHTDNVPIGPALAEKFPTNWELSTARATTVVRYLAEKGVDAKYLSAEGYSEYRPVSPNDTDEGKSKNRRIEIVLIPMDVNK